MKTLERILKTGSLCVFLVFASCSSDDSNGDNGGDDEGQHGANHTYDIQLTNGSETIEISGSLPNIVTSPIAVYLDEEESSPDLTMHMADSERVITGAFYLNNNQQPLPLSIEGFDEENGSLLVITTPELGMLTSTSGTATFSNFEIYGLESIPEMLASFTLNFEGVFQDMQNDVTYQGTGTVVVQPIGH